MPEALIVTNGDYSAAELRQLIALGNTAGIVRGLVIAGASGRNVTISRGAAVIDDADGVDSQGRYGAYIQTDTTLEVPSGTANWPIYISCHPTSGAIAITGGATPTNPNLPLGSASASTTAVTSVSNTASKSFHPGVGVATVKATGDTMTGPLIVSGPTTGVVTAEGGVKLGLAANPTKRLYVKAYLSANQLIATADVNKNYVAIKFNSATAGRNINDYGGTFLQTTTGRFYAPVAGSYLFGGHVRWVDVTTPTGARLLILRVTTPSDNTYTRLSTQGYGVDGYPMHSTFAMPIDMNAGDYVTIEGYTGQAGSGFKASTVAPNGEGTWVCGQLVTAF